MSWIISVISGSLLKKFNPFQLIVGSLVFGIALLSLWHYNHLINQVAKLKSDNSQLEMVIDQQRLTVDKAIESVKSWEKAQNNLIQTLNEYKRVSEDANKQLRKLNQTFAKHDLSKISNARPQLIERLLNDSTDESMFLLTCKSNGSTCTTPTKRSDTK